VLASNRKIKITLENWGDILLIRRILLAFFVVLTGASGTAWAEPPSQTVLEIAVFPYLSTRAVLGTYHPLQQYLEKQLQRPVLIVTAPDMQTFVERTQAGAYSYVVTAPHFARLAQREAGYRPLLRAKRNLQGVILVSTTRSGIRDVAELRGKTVATPDDLAIVTQLGLALLREHGLQPGKNVQLQESPSHSSAALSVKNGTVDAAIVSITAFMQMPEEQRQGLRVLAQTAEVPHVMFLSGPRVPAKDADRFADLMRQFVEQSEDGRRFIDSLGYVGLRAPTEQELRSLDPYVDGLKAALAKQPKP